MSKKKETVVVFRYKKNEFDNYSIHENKSLEFMKKRIEEFNNSSLSNFNNSGKNKDNGDYYKIIEDPDVIKALLLKRDFDNEYLDKLEEIKDTIEAAIDLFSNTFSSIETFIADFKEERKGVCSTGEPKPRETDPKFCELDMWDKFYFEGVAYCKLGNRETDNCVNVDMNVKSINTETKVVRASTCSNKEKSLSKTE